MSKTLFLLFSWQFSKQDYSEPVTETKSAKITQLERSLDLTDISDVEEAFDTAYLGSNSASSVIDSLFTANQEGKDEVVSSYLIGITQQTNSTLEIEILSEVIERSLTVYSATLGSLFINVLRRINSEKQCQQPLPILLQTITNISNNSDFILLQLSLAGVDACIPVIAPLTEASVEEEKSPSIAEIVTSLNATALAAIADNNQQDILNISQELSQSFNGSVDVKSVASVIAKAAAINGNLSSSVVGSGILLAEEGNEQAVSGLLIALTDADLDSLVQDFVDNTAAINITLTSRALSSALLSQSANKLIDGSLSSLLQGGSEASGRAIVRAFSMIIIGSGRQLSSELLLRLFSAGQTVAVASAYVQAGSERQQAQNSLKKFIEDSDQDISQAISRMLSIGGRRMSNIVAWALSRSIATSQAVNIISSLVTNGHVTTALNTFTSAIQGSSKSSAETTLFKTFRAASSASLYRNLGLLTSGLIVKQSIYLEFVSNVLLRLISSSNVQASAWIISSASSTTQFYIFITTFVTNFPKGQCETLGEVVSSAVVNIGGDNSSLIEQIRSINKESGCVVEASPVVVAPSPSPVVVAAPSPPVSNGALLETSVTCERWHRDCKGIFQRTCCTNDISQKKIGDICEVVSRTYEYAGVCSSGQKRVLVQSTSAGNSCTCSLQN
eukprot:TRINITY_DN4255_c0_g3_i5.p1 TRINITY_DN4255_c0_g3~~TRINITY_DN4255_c0_g3_i5.p1  ORF type:complete len:673 (+),score=86.13 TRINITY_DN4255_c0_g3_i5:1175-3193(+)